jgi:hypothetical protein
MVAQPAQAIARDAAIHAVEANRAGRVFWIMEAPDNQWVSPES